MSLSPWCIGNFDFHGGQDYVAAKLSRTFSRSVQNLITNDAYTMFREYKNVSYKIVIYLSIIIFHIVFLAISEND